MIRSLVLAATAMTIVAGSAQAGGCNRPYAPTIKAGRSATVQDIETLRKDVTSFIKASDIYQSCLLAHKREASLISANQAEKERVGREFNAVARAFRAAHPG